MAIRLIEEYPNRVGAPTADYPHGVPRNKSTPTATDGTPFEQSWFRDQEGFFQGLMETAGITPSGEPDTVLNSDYLDALNRVTNGVIEVDMAGAADVSLSAYQGRVAALKLTGALAADVDLIVPDTERMYWIIDETTGDFSVTVKTAAGTGVKLFGESSAVRSDGTNVVSFVNGMDNRVIYVETIADLQSLPTSELLDGQCIIVTETGRSGSFVVRAGDFSSSVTSDPKHIVWVPFDNDPDGSAIVAMRLYSRWQGIAMEWAGVVGGDVAQPVENLQAAYDYADNSGTSLQLSDIYAYTGTLTAHGDVAISGNGEDVTQLHCVNTDGSDAVRLSDDTYVRGFEWKGFRILSGPSAGHAVVVGFGFTRVVLDIAIEALNPTKSCIYGEFIGQGGVYSSVFGGGEYRITTDHQVPAVSFHTDGARVQTNRFIPKRGYFGRDMHWLVIECTSSSSWCSGNEISGIEFEVTNGGMIALYGCRDCFIERNPVYDIAGANGGALLNDGILLSSSGGLPCEDITISRYSRIGGGLAAGVHDIYLEDAQDTIFVNMSSPTSWGVSIDVNNKRSVFIGSAGGISFTNLNLTNTTFIEPGKIRTPLFATPRLASTSEIVSNTIGSPSHTYIAVDTENDATTDLLSQIGAGSVDGQHLIIRTLANTREVTITHGTGNIYTKSGADVTLSEARQTISLIWDSSLSSWLEI